MLFRAVAWLVAHKKRLFADQCFSRSGNDETRRDLHSIKKTTKKTTKKW